MSADIAGTTWRPLFLVNVPIGIVAVLLCLRTVPVTGAACVGAPAANGGVRVEQREHPKSCAVQP